MCQEISLNISKMKEQQIGSTDVAMAASHSHENHTWGTDERAGGLNRCTSEQVAARIWE
jgi:hypothetical protein